MLPDSVRWPCRKATETYGSPRVSTRTYPPDCKYPHRFAYCHSNADAQRQVESAGYRSLTTQIFDKDSKYLEDDSVFAVKDGLTVEFKPRKGDSQAEWDLEYDVTLAKKQ